jgi:hypothetical protein
MNGSVLRLSRLVNLNTLNTLPGAHSYVQHSVDSAAHCVCAAQCGQRSTLWTAQHGYVHHSMDSAAQWGQRSTVMCSTV